MKLLTKKVITRRIILGIVLFFFLICFVQLIRGMQKLSLHSDAPPDYWELFKSSAHRINFQIAVNNKKEPPVATFLYKNYYCIYVKELLHNEELPLGSLITEIRGCEALKGETIWSSTYTSSKRAEYFLSTHIEPVDRFHKLYLVIDGDSMSVSKNDSCFIYSLSLNNFAVKYEARGKVDVHLKKRWSFDKLRVEIEVLKKNKNVYLIIMCPMRDQQFIGSDSIKDVIS